MDGDCISNDDNRRLGAGGRVDAETARATRDDKAREEGPLYARLLGPQWPALPAQIRAMHSVDGKLVAVGRAEVQRGTGLLSRLAGAIIGFLGSVLGVGGSFIMIPAMIYLLKVPTKVVIGTSLFQTVFVSGFTTVVHAVAKHE